MDGIAAFHVMFTLGDAEVTAYNVLNIGLQLQSCAVCIKVCSALVLFACIQQCLEGIEAF